MFDERKSLHADMSRGTLYSLAPRSSSQGAFRHIVLGRRRFELRKVILDRIPINLGVGSTTTWISILIKNRIKGVLTSGHAARGGDGERYMKGEP